MSISAAKSKAAFEQTIFDVYMATAIGEMCQNMALGNKSCSLKYAIKFQQKCC
jgi:hypothetical protein